MKVTIDATPEELEEKQVDLIKALIDQMGDVNLEAVDALTKALPPKKVALKNKAMRQLARDTKRRYKETLDAMIEEIEAVMYNPQKAVDYLNKSTPSVDEDTVVERTAQKVLEALEKASKNTEY